jgi:hypothetical protein
MHNFQVLMPHHFAWQHDARKSRSGSISPHEDGSLISRQMLRVLEERDEWKSKYDELELEMKGMRERVKTSLDFLSRCFVCF